MPGYRTIDVGLGVLQEPERACPGQGCRLLVERVRPVALEEPVCGVGIDMVGHVFTGDVHAPLESFDACSGNPRVSLGEMKEKPRPAPGEIAVSCSVVDNRRVNRKFGSLRQPERPVPAHGEANLCDVRARDGFVMGEVVDGIDQLPVGRGSSGGRSLCPEAHGLELGGGDLPGIEVRRKRDETGFGKSIAEAPEERIEPPPGVQNNHAGTGTGLRDCQVMGRCVHDAYRELGVIGAWAMLGSTTLSAPQPVQPLPVFHRQ